MFHFHLALLLIKMVNSGEQWLDILFYFGHQNDREPLKQAAALSTNRW